MQINVGLDRYSLDRGQLTSTTNQITNSLEKQTLLNKSNRFFQLSNVDNDNWKYRTLIAISLNFRKKSSDAWLSPPSACIGSMMRAATGLLDFQLSIKSSTSSKHRACEKVDNLLW